jgi:hypothetical protein
VIAALALLLAAASAAPDVPDAWSARRAIVLPALAGRGFVEVALDAEIYARAAPELADLRVREPGGAEVAYVLRRHEQPERRTARELRTLDLVVTPEARTRFVLDAGDGASVHHGVELRIDARGRSFRVPVRVETSLDRRQWDLARAAGFIYDVTGESRAADTTVTYPPSTARWLRVSIDPVDRQAVVVTGAAIRLDTPAAREEEPVAVAVVERTDDTPRKRSRLTLDLGGRRPIDRLELDVVDRNFHRVVLVEAGDDRQQWRWVGSAAVSALETPRVRERHTTVRVPETAARYLRLTIDNHDARPLEIAGVRAAAVRRGLVFEAVPGGEYVLDYGNARATAPRYDLGPAVRSLGGERLAQATLGPPVTLPPPGRAPWLDAQPVVMWSAMAVAVLALGALLFRLARGLRAP